MTINQICSNENNIIEIDQRRIDLFNDPNYGIILCFLDKYRSLLDLPNYPLQIFEDDLINYQEQNSPQLIDFHLILLKRISFIRNMQYDRFDSIITKFASRFDINDGEHLSTYGYLQSNIHIKIRILKNLLESQFDLNQTFKNILNNQTSRQIKSLPFGRDRFGVSYWFFMDENCFIRLFREDINIDRTWTIIAKNRDELEKFIKLLITDLTVRKKFPDWTIDYESFSCLSLSNEFEQYYSPIEIPLKRINNQIDLPMKQQEEKLITVKKKRGRPKMQIITRSYNKKRHLDDDEISIDDMSLAIRSQKQSINKTKSQLFNKKKKRNNHRRQSTSNSDDHYSSSSSSSSSFNINDDHFFDLDEDSIDEQIHSAKTAQTSTINTECYICLKNDRPELLLLCDNCNDAYHLECLRPILLSVPDDDWFCPLCEHKQLANCLIKKFDELLNNFNRIELQRKIPKKVYISDESTITSESEFEINENQNNISQRGRHRRIRFNMKKILDNYYSDDDSQQEIIDFDLQLPEKITRLLHRRNRNTEQQQQQIKTLSIRSDHISIDSNDPSELNEKLGSPIVYISSDGQSHEIKSMITNSKQTSQIVRRWNDVQRRSRLKAINMKLSMTSDYTDENSNHCLDDTSLDNTINHVKINLNQPTNLISFDTYSSKNIIQKVDANFDRLTRDIQFAVTEAHLLPTTTINSDQQHVKKIQKKLFSPFVTKNQLPLVSSDVCNMFKSEDCSTSNIIPTHSLLDTIDDSTVQITNNI